MTKSIHYDQDTGIYCNSQEREHIFLLLLKSAIKYFKSAYRINELRKFEKAWDAHDSQSIKSFSEEYLLDTIKIIICFENYMKGKLVNDGYLVHSIDSKVANGKFKILATDKRPIKIADYEKIGTYVWRKSDGQYYLIGLKKRTISFGTLLNDAYNEIIKLPNDVSMIINKMYDYRNSLHLRIELAEIFKSNFITETKKLIEFVNGHMILKHNELIMKCEKPRTLINEII